jgi:hypothetical protein
MEGLPMQKDTIEKTDAAIKAIENLDKKEVKSVRVKTYKYFNGLSQKTIIDGHFAAGRLLNEADNGTKDNKLKGAINRALFPDLFGEASTKKPETVARELANMRAMAMSEKDLRAWLKETACSLTSPNRIMGAYRKKAAPRKVVPLGDKWKALDKRFTTLLDKMQETDGDEYQQAEKEFTIFCNHVERVVRNNEIDDNSVKPVQSTESALKIAKEKKSEYDAKQEVAANG